MQHQLTTAAAAVTFKKTDRHPSPETHSHIWVEMKMEFQLRVPREESKTKPKQIEKGKQAVYSFSHLRVVPCSCRNSVFIFISQFTPSAAHRAES